jgi:hypothetical protein
MNVKPSLDYTASYLEITLSRPETTLDPTMMRGDQAKIHVGSIVRPMTRSENQMLRCRKNGIRWGRVKKAGRFS